MYGPKPSRIIIFRRSNADTSNVHHVYHFRAPATHATYAAGPTPRIPKFPNDPSTAYMQYTCDVNANPGDAVATVEAGVGFGCERCM